MTLCSRMSSGRAPRSPRAWAALALVLVLSLLGCAELAPSAGQPLPEAPLAQLPASAPVVVQAAAEPASAAFGSLVRGKVSGALVYGGLTFGFCEAGLHTGGSCSGGPMCGWVEQMILAICTVTAGVGLGVGAVLSPWGSEVDALEATLQTALAAPWVQPALAQATVAGLSPTRAVAPPAAPTLPQLASRGPRLSLRLVEGRGQMPAHGQGAGLVLHAQWRLDGPGRPPAQGEVLHELPRLPQAQWLAPDGQAMQRWLHQGVAALGEQVQDVVWHLWPFVSTGPVLGAWGSSSWGLAAVAPPVHGTYTGDFWLGRWLEWAEAPNRQPTLVWEPFPRAADLALQPDLAGRIGQVSYELRLAPEQQGQPGAPVQHWTQLTEPRLALPEPLPPGSRWFWTVRARFVLDGQERVTPWSHTRWDAARYTAPSRASYRFRVPDGP